MGTLALRAAGRAVRVIAQPPTAWPLLHVSGMRRHPIQLEVSSPPRFDRIQLLIRIALSMFLGWLGITMGWLTSVLFFALPIFAAAVVSTRGATTYRDSMAPSMWPAFRWLFGFGAYMLLLADRVPVGEQTSVTSELHTSGRPTAGSALARLLLSIPSALVLCFLAIVSCVLWLVGAASILIGNTVPASILEFQTGFLRWHARLLAYHASFVEEYPPFSFGDRAATTPTARMVAP
jgi:hypothetical protein